MTQIQINMVQIVFSPTGGTQKVADAITGTWREPVQKVDLSDAAAGFSAVRLGEDDPAVIAVPSFGGRVPALAAQRLGQVHGGRARCVVVCVYGNPRERPRETDGKTCISCMRCAAICPQSARKANSALVAVAARAIKKACAEQRRNELFC